MLFWPMAANAPSTIERIETKMTIWRHCVDRAGKAPISDADEQRHGGDLGRGGEEAP